MNASEEISRPFLEDIVNLASSYLSESISEAEIIYCFCSLEAGQYFFNFLYKINNQIVRNHKVNAVLKNPVELVPGQVWELQEKGINLLEQLENELNTRSLPVPAQIQITYKRMLNKYEINYLFTPQYSIALDKTIMEVYDAWAVQLENNS